MIQRIRWVIMKDNRTKIYCGLSRDYKFRPIGNIGNAAIKTYRSKKVAEAGFSSSWGTETDFEAVKITETYEWEE